MRKNKSYIYIILIALCILGSYFIFANSKNSKLSPTPGVGEMKSETVIQKDAAENEVTLLVQNKTYTIEIKAGNTVYDAMTTLEDTKGINFAFHAKEYSSLGNFVDEINGIKGTPSKYWIYYINGKEASVGVSKYVLKSGDVISWKQEAF